MLQDERLARFVTGSHIRHHPNVGDMQGEEDLVRNSLLFLCAVTKIIHCMIHVLILVGESL